MNKGASFSKVETVSKKKMHVLCTICSRENRICGKCVVQRKQQNFFDTIYLRILSELKVKVRILQWLNFSVFITVVRISYFYD